MKKFIAVFYTLILFSYQLHAGFSLQKITSESFPDIRSNNYDQLILDGKLYFLVNNNITVSDGTNFGTKILNFGDQAPINVARMQLLGDRIIFIDEYDQLWSTDGTSAQMIAEDLRAFLGQIFKVDGILFVTIANYPNPSQLLRITENELTLIPEINNDGARRMCLFDANNFISPNRQPSTEIENQSIRTLDLYNNGKITTLYTREDDNPLPSFIRYHDGYCYYGNATEKFRINAQMEVETIIVPDGIDGTFSINKSGNDLYFINAGKAYQLINGSNKLMLVYDLLKDIGDLRNSYQHYGFRANDNYIYSWARAQNFDPEGDITFVYDKEFNLITTSSNIIFNDLVNPSEIGAGIMPFISTINGNDYLLTARQDEILQSHLGYTQTDKYLETPQLKISLITGDESNIFVFATNTNVQGKTSLYKLTEQPLVSQQMTGIWVNPAWDNQGLIISTGTRTDDSIYMFISMFLYRDGNPLWFAGNADITLSEPSITIDMAEYKGSSFLPGTQADSEIIPFGTINLTPISCNQINMDISPDAGAAINLVLDRITNKGTRGCTD